MAFFLLDFIFPKICFICDARKGFICSQCLKTLPWPTLKCFKCNRKNPFGVYCRDCKKDYLPDRIVSRFIYEGKLKDAIHQYKFEDAYLLSEDFSLALLPIIKGIDGYNKYVLTYIPLDKRRQRYRGYNQSKILAERLADRLKMTSVDLLERKEQEETQVFAKTKSARRKNVKGVFTVRSGAKIPKKIILIDDVVTTGATVEEATKVLKKAGAREVIVVALAMGR